MVTARYVHLNQSCIRGTALTCRQYWRRRFFSLEGTRLTAYHEATHQPRATINLAKAAKLIDDKSALTQKETSTKGGGRRKSAFSEEEEGYMFVEEGFRIRFGNGEVIDFYADNRENKEGWMKALSGLVGRGGSAQAGGSGNGGKVNGWTEIVLKREGSLKEKRSPAKKQRVPSAENKRPADTMAPRTGSGGSAKTGPDFGMPPVSPRKSSKNQTPAQAQKDAQATTPREQVTSSQAPPAPDKSPRHQAMQVPQRPGHARTESHQGVTGKRTGLEGHSPPKSSRHQKTKSMILDGAFW